jgi:hypothetical protein
MERCGVIFESKEGILGAIQGMTHFCKCAYSMWGEPLACPGE